MFLTIDIVFAYQCFIGASISLLCSSRHWPTLLTELRRASGGWRPPKHLSMRLWRNTQLLILALIDLSPCFAAPAFAKASPGTAPVRRPGWCPRAPMCLKSKTYVSSIEPTPKHHPRNYEWPDGGCPLWGSEGRP